MDLSLRTISRGRLRTDRITLSNCGKHSRIHSMRLRGQVVTQHTSSLRAPANMVQMMLIALYIIQLDSNAVELFSCSLCTFSDLSSSRLSKLTCCRWLPLCNIQILRYKRSTLFQQPSWASSRTLRFRIPSTLPLNASLAIATQSEAATGAIALCWRSCTAPIAPMFFPAASLICATQNKAHWTAILEELAYQCHPVLCRYFANTLRRCSSRTSFSLESLFWVRC